MRRGSRVLALAGAAALVALLSASTAAAVDRRAEAAAKVAINKASSDYLATNYDAAATRLQKALRVCGAKRCTPGTRAALLRDLGTMQFRSGDVGAAKKTLGRRPAGPGRRHPQPRLRHARSARRVRGGARRDRRRRDGRAALGRLRPHPGGRAASQYAAARLRRVLGLRRHRARRRQVQGRRDERLGQGRDEAHGNRLGRPNPCNAVPRA